MTPSSPENLEITFFLLAIFWILEHCVLLGNWHYDFLSKRCSGELSVVICPTQLRSLKMKYLHKYANNITKLWWPST